MTAARGWGGAFDDTVCTVPDSAFEDSTGTLVDGDYLLTVTAINGKWKSSALGFIPGYGNVSGAVGTFGCAVVARPVIFTVPTNTSSD